MNGKARTQFQERVWAFYREQGRRELPWRVQLTPYGVFVSEIMLQQTQVSRVLGRWERWAVRWPGFRELAAASVAEVLAEWQGLGYNRRALALRAAAQMVVSEFGDELPCDPGLLVRLPGVGPNTAGSVAAFAYNEPVVFIETNIRRVFLHHYGELAAGAEEDSLRTEPALARRVRSESFAAPGPADGISDAQLRPLVEAGLDRERPREWYWALMDYGADLAKRVPNPNRRSKHYLVQSRFEGSVRQLRGEVLRRLLAGPKAADELGIVDARLEAVLTTLVREGFVTERAGRYSI